MKSVAHDEQNLYLKENGQEVIIPFMEVKEIKLKSATGTHSIRLFRDLGFGKEFYFKSSPWYPFNFKKVDDQVYELQKKIDYAKAHFQEQNVNALGS